MTKLAEKNSLFRVAPRKLKYSSRIGFKLEIFLISSSSLNLSSGKRNSFNIVVVSLMFFVAKVGDDIDVEFVGGEDAVGVNISCSKNVITEMSGYRLHFHATLIGAFGVRCFE